ncbi:hypothetical protein H6F67_25820 [Microcoleus sp. FACHB-1515]|uniref:hypothetical protein n=1 Tax=Cyanophyceae TaxID=3028117 RepID=UPI0016826DF9|nr:hypothetical protein [Microcoleus sp. FACHB-1515]MBD2093267.1 hypothetical protein [Microcoleus sp. FACHB-1515]
MKIKGIKRGQTIELIEAIDIPDGTEISIEIDEQQLISAEERQMLELYYGSRDELADNRPLASFIGAAKGSFATPEEGRSVHPTGA